MRAAISCVDLVKGQADSEATTRLANKVAALTDIDPAVSRRLAGRFDVSEFHREFDRHERQGDRSLRRRPSRASIPIRIRPVSRFGDPSGDPLIAPLTSAGGRPHHEAELNWQPDGSYQLLNGPVSRLLGFRPRANPAESISQLRQNSRARSEPEAPDRPRPVRSRDALPRLEDGARPTAGLCEPGPRQAQSSIPAATCSLRDASRGRSEAKSKR